MNIKTLISLNEKIETLNEELSTQTIGESLFDMVTCFFLLPLSIFSSLFMIYNFEYNPLFAIIGFFIFPFFRYIVPQLLRKKKSNKFHLLFKLTYKLDTKFKRNSIIQRVANKLNDDEVLLIQELIEEEKNKEPSPFTSLDLKILDYAKTASKKDIQTILKSITKQRVKYKLFEFIQDTEEQEISLSKQKIIKSI